MLALKVLFKGCDKAVLVVFFIFVKFSFSFLLLHVYIMCECDLVYDIETVFHLR